MIKCFLLISLEDGWKHPDTGEVFARPHKAPVGAMWFAAWYDIPDSNPKRYHFDWDNQFTPPLLVKTPGGIWNVDSRASNCTKPDDKTHRCWCRHGEAPNITVDKNGNTCAAGAGSIQCGDYHGFLQHGFLT